MKQWFKRTCQLLMNPAPTVKKGEVLLWEEHSGLFLIDMPSHSLKGYYMLELTIKNASSRLDSAFYINESSASSIEMQLPIKTNGTFKRVCYFPEKVESISWQPSQCAGSLESVDLVLKKVTKGFAISRMLKKLKLKTFTSNLDNLLSAYEKRFDTRSSTIEPTVESVALGGDAYVYLSNDGLSCLNISSTEMSKEDKAWVEENHAVAFVRTFDGKIKRLDK